ncbi:MAG: hypothetical protein J6T01_05335 [Kiritimatiellae bacterium]|nr:hypothetical protein [Kiritimatiellia bacterium]
MSFREAFSASIKTASRISLSSFIHFSFKYSLHHIARIAPFPRSYCVGILSKSHRQRQGGGAWVFHHVRRFGGNARRHVLISGRSHGIPRGERRNMRGAPVAAAGGAAIHLDRASIAHAAHRVRDVRHEAGAEKEKAARRPWRTAFPLESRTCYFTFVYP